MQQLLIENNHIEQISRYFILDNELIRDCEFFDGKDKDTNFIYFEVFDL